MSNTSPQQRKGWSGAVGGFPGLGTPCWTRTHSQSFISGPTFFLCKCEPLLEERWTNMPDKRFVVEGREILNNKLTLALVGLSAEKAGEKRAVSVYIFQHADKITVLFKWHLFTPVLCDSRGDEKAGRPAVRGGVLTTFALPSSKAGNWSAAEPHWAQRNQGSSPPHCCITQQSCDTRQGITNLCEPQFLICKTRSVLKHCCKD